MTFIKHIPETQLTQTIVFGFATNVEEAFLSVFFVSKNTVFNFGIGYDLWTHAMWHRFSGKNNEFTDV